MTRPRLVAVVLVPILLLAGGVTVSLGVRASGARWILPVAGAPTHYPVAIVPGAAVWGKETLSHVLEDRVLTAVRLWKEGRVKKLLFSGRHDGHDYDEVNAMRRFARRQGVPPQDIFLDHAGFTTYQTMYRAREVFRIETAVVVTQRYHLYRALYTARSLGIRAWGEVADRRPYVNISGYRVRDFFARIKAWLQAGVFRPLPDHLGRPHPVGGDGRSTHDLADGK